MNRGETLKKAEELVYGDRAKEYGPPSENFARIAKMWGVILKKEVSTAEVAMCLIALKLTRLIQSNNHPDSFIDICGYAACGNEIITEHNEDKQNG